MICCRIIARAIQTWLQNPLAVSAYEAFSLLLGSPAVAIMGISVAPVFALAFWLPHGFFAFLTVPPAGRPIHVSSGIGTDHLPCM